MNRAATAPALPNRRTQIFGATLVMFAIFEVGYRWNCQTASASQDQMLTGFLQRHGQAAERIAANWRTDHALPTEQDLRDLKELTRAYDADPSRVATPSAMAPSARNAATFWKEKSMTIQTLLTSWCAFALSAFVSFVLGLKLVHQGRASQRDAAKSGHV